MEMWLQEHPEIKHFWGENMLKISDPIEEGKFIQFDLSKNTIAIEYKGKITEFKKERLKNLKEQVFAIQGFWINQLFTEEELDIRKPMIFENQFLTMLTNRKYGQVLTLHGNLFTGWGEVYKVFDDLESARNYRFDKLKKGFECSIFDANNELITDIK